MGIKFQYRSLGKENQADAGKRTRVGTKTKFTDP
jgi:hypothetical protein